MTALNFALWSAAVALHLALLATLVLRGTVRRLPAFTGLLGFYLLRSVLLYSLSGHVSKAAYGLGYSLLSSLDLLLQVLVAWELLRRSRQLEPSIARVPGRWRPLASFSGCALLAAAFAWALSLRVHTNPHTPLDRGVVFCSALMLAVAALLIGKTIPSNIRSVMQGFCMLSLTSVLCQVERSRAALERNAAMFQRWSYAEAVVYLVVLLFWLVSLNVHGWRRAAKATMAPGSHVRTLRQTLG